MPLHTPNHFSIDPATPTSTHSLQEEGPAGGGAPALTAEEASTVGWPVVEHYLATARATLYDGASRWIDRCTRER